MQPRSDPAQDRLLQLTQVLDSKAQEFQMAMDDLTRAIHTMTLRHADATVRAVEERENAVAALKKNAGRVVAATRGRLKKTLQTKELEDLENEYETNRKFLQSSAARMQRTRAAGGPSVADELFASMGADSETRHSAAYGVTLAPSIPLAVLDESLDLSKPRIYTTLPSANPYTSDFFMTPVLSRRLVEFELQLRDADRNPCPYITEEDIELVFMATHDSELDPVVLSAVFDVEAELSVVNIEVKLQDSAMVPMSVMRSAKMRCIVAGVELHSFDLFPKLYPETYGTIAGGEDVDPNDNEEILADIYKNRVVLACKESNEVCVIDETDISSFNLAEGTKIWHVQLLKYDDPILQIIDTRAIPNPKTKNWVLCLLSNAANQFEIKIAVGGEDYPVLLVRQFSNAPGDSWTDKFTNMVSFSYHESQYCLYWRNGQQLWLDVLDITSVLDTAANRPPAVLVDSAFAADTKVRSRGTTATYANNSENITMFDLSKTPRTTTAILSGESYGMPDRKRAVAPQAQLLDYVAPYYDAETGAECFSVLTKGSMSEGFEARVYVDGICKILSRTSDTWIARASWYTLVSSSIDTRPYIVQKLWDFNMVNCTWHYYPM